MSPTKGDLRVWRIPELFHSDKFYLEADSIQDAQNTLEILKQFDSFIAPSIPQKPRNIDGIEIFDGKEWVECAQDLIS